jgi:hypothetical protein
MGDLWTPPGQPLWNGGWINGFIIQPGAHADYYAGRFRPEGVVVHYTVGTDSTAIGLRGIFPLLLPKVGPAKQFSPIDAVNFHACEWNRRMAGGETEKYQGYEDRPDYEETTPDQIKSWATIAAAMYERFGLGFGYHSGARIPIGAPLPWNGAFYIAHRSLVHHACDQHSDYLPDADMAKAFALAGGGASPVSDRRRRVVAAS